MFTRGRLQTLTSGCVSPLRGCRCEVQNAKKMGKCNADFGASFRCLSQLNTVARQIPWGPCTTAPAPNVNVSCVVHAHWCFHSNSLMTVKSRQHFTEQAQTELAINLLTEKIPKGKRSKVWLYFTQKDSNIDTCSKCNKTSECKHARTADQQPKTEKYTEMIAKLPTVVSSRGSTHFLVLRSEE